MKRKISNNLLSLCTSKGLQIKRITYRAHGQIVGHGFDIVKDGFVLCEFEPVQYQYYPHKWFARMNMLKDVFTKDYYSNQTEIIEELIKFL